MRMQPGKISDHAAPERSWPYTAIIEYCVGWDRPKHVICAESPTGLRAAFEVVNARVEGAAKYGEMGGFIEEARIKGPFGQKKTLESLAIGLFWNTGVPPQGISNAIRSLEMH